MKLNDYDKNIYTNTYTSNNEECTLLLKIVFSEKNINIIQKKIISIIKKKHKYIISEQSEQALLNIMRNIYDSYSKHSYNNKKELIKEVREINKLIINYCVDDIIKNIYEYQNYLKKIDNDFCVEQIQPWDRIGKHITKKNTFEFKNYK